MKKKIFNIFLKATFSFLVLGFFFSGALTSHSAYFNGDNNTNSTILCNGLNPSVFVNWASVPGAVSYNVEPNSDPSQAFNLTNTYFTDASPDIQGVNNYAIQAIDSGGFLIDWWVHNSAPAVCSMIQAGTSSSGPFSNGPLSLSSGDILWFRVNQTVPVATAPGNMPYCVWTPPLSGAINPATVGPVNSSHPNYPLTQAQGGTSYSISCDRGASYGTEQWATDSVIVYGASGGGSPTNNPPTANAGSDRTITLPTSSTTASSASASDTDGTIQSVAWTFVSGPSTPTITGANTLTPTFSNLTTAGTYTFRLIATDDDGANSTPDTMIVTVNPATNNPPTANAGSDRTITLPTSSTTASSASASDTDGTIQSVAWTFVSGPSTPTITGANTLTPTFSNLTTAGTYTFRLIATDDDGANSAPDTMIVTVNPASPPPPGPPQGTISGTACVIPANQSSCQTTLNWSTSNLTANPTSVTRNYPSANTFVSSATSGTNVNHTISFSGATLPGQVGFTLNHNSSALANTSITIACASSTAWNGSTCAISSNSAPSVGMPNNVVITLPTNFVNDKRAFPGDSDGFVTSAIWTKVAGPSSYTITNPSAPVANLAVDNPTNSTTTNFTNLVQGVYTFRMTATDNAGASGYGQFNITVNAAAMSGYLTPGATQCIIPAGSSSCNINFSWNVTNPGGASTVTSSTNNSGASSPGFLVASGHQGNNVPFAVPHSSRSFFLYNGATLLDSDVVTSICATSSTWNGSICEPSSGPDLTAGLPPQNTATVGVPTNFTSVITNTGTAGTGSSFYNLFQIYSHASSITTDITPAVSMGALSASGGSATATSSSYTFSAGGAHDVRACADKSSSSDGGTISEPAPSPNGEFNNCGPWKGITVSLPPSQPDLTATDPAPTSAVAGSPTTFSSTITNNGTAGTGVAFPNLFLFDNDSDHTSVFATAVSTIGPIPATGSLPATAMSPAMYMNSFANAEKEDFLSSLFGKRVVAYTFPTAGTWYVRACADNDASFAGSVSEANEGNNCSNWSTVNVSSAGGPDLTAGTVSPTTATGGVAQTYTATISNIGTAGTGAGFPYFFQRATGANGSGTIGNLASSNMLAINAGGSRTATSPSVNFANGIRSMRVCADDTSPSPGGDVISETDENNNCGPWTDITVGPSGPGAPTVNLVATPSAVASVGMTSTLTWSSSNLSGSDYCTSNFFSGNGPVSDSTGIVVTPTYPSSTYSITCYQISTSTQVSDLETVTVGSASKEPVFIEN